MIISKAKKWKLLVAKEDHFYAPCDCCRKEFKKYFILYSNPLIAICTRCMKQINRATSKYFEGEKNGN